RDERAALVQAISEADARRKIIFVGRDQTIVDERHAGQRVRRVACLHKTVRRLRGRCSCARAELCWIEVDEATTYVNRIAVEVVAQAEVQRQTAAELVVVLHEAVEVVHAQRAIIDARTDDRDAAADEKAAEVGEDDLPAREGVEEEVDLRAAVFAAGADAMAAAHERDGIGEGESVDARRL